MQNILVYVKLFKFGTSVENRFFFFLSVGFDIVKYQCLIKPTKTT